MMSSRTRAPRRASGRHPRSVRVRILTAVLVVALLGMAGAGVTSYLIARAQTQANVYAALEQEVEEFRTSTGVALDEETGVPITDLEELLSYAIQMTYPSDDEAVLGIVDGEVRRVPGAGIESPFQTAVQEDAEFVALASSVAPGQSPGVYRAHTAVHPDLAFISVPVQIKGEESTGHYVTAIDLTAAFANINRAYLVFAYVAVVALVLAGVIGYGVAGRLLAPLRSLRTTAQQISEDDLTGRIPAEQLARGDEVADLGRTVNAMLDRLATSFDSQRQALDDVGHELRTPITIIQGHQELLDVDDPAEVEAARAITLEELDRMQRLVDDLMLLAKSRRPDFLRPRPADVEALLLAVLEKVSPLGERRWQIESASGLRAELDPERITQALLQLVANALRFTDTGAVIALGAQADGEALRVWVRDEGTGIAREHQEQIFDRHRSTDSADHTHHMGLGLTIVTAIAAAHGGRVELDSAPDWGSRFTIVLPAGHPVGLAGVGDVPGHDAPGHDVPGDGVPRGDAHANHVPGDGARGDRSRHGGESSPAYPTTSLEEFPWQRS